VERGKEDLASEIKDARSSIKSVDPGQLVPTTFSGGAAAELLGARGTSYLVHLPSTDKKKPQIYVGVQAFFRGTPQHPIRWASAYKPSALKEGQNRWLIDLCFITAYSFYMEDLPILVNISFRQQCLKRGMKLRWYLSVTEERWFDRPVPTALHGVGPIVHFEIGATDIEKGSNIPLAVWHLDEEVLGYENDLLATAKKADVAVVVYLRVQEKKPETTEENPWSGPETGK
jgi:hypothetical protein